MQVINDSDENPDLIDGQILAINAYHFIIEQISKDSSESTKLVSHPVPHLIVETAPTDWERFKELDQ